MEKQTYVLQYHGHGFDFFKIQIVNAILCIITLGLYYPWAKARTINYLYSQTAFEDQPFLFTGTGEEMFKGFVKAFAILVILYGGLIMSAFIGPGMFQIGLLCFYLVFLAMVPLIIHGSYRYRMAKTVWRGIRFGYTGDRGELVKLFFLDLLLTILTFGIYGAWFLVHMRTYVISHVRIGNAKFEYKGNGGDYFFLNLKGYFLSILSLGIYFFWWQKNLLAFFVNNTYLTDGDKKVSFKSTVTAGDIFVLFLVNLLIIVFTLGLGYAWVLTRTLRIIMSKIVIDGDFSFEQLAQTQSDYSDATGTDMSDFFDFGFII